MVTEIVNLEDLAEIENVDREALEATENAEKVDSIAVKRKKDSVVIAEKIAVDLVEMIEEAVQEIEIVDQAMDTANQIKEHIPRILRK